LYSYYRNWDRGMLFSHWYPLNLHLIKNEWYIFVLPSKNMLFWIGGSAWFLLKIRVRKTGWNILEIYRVTHKGWDFRDDCTKFILFVCLYSWFPATMILFLFAKPFNKSFKDHTRGRQLNLNKSSFKSSSQSHPANY